MTEAGWIQIVTLVLAALGSGLAAYLSFLSNRKVGQVAEKTEAVALRVEETKSKIDETQGKVDETMLRLDGRLTQLVEHVRMLSRAEGKAEAEAEAKVAAATLIETNAVATEKLVKDKAEAEALVLETAEKKAQNQRIEEALLTNEARKAMQLAKTETAELAEKNARATPDPGTQDVTIEVTGPMQLSPEQELAQKKVAEEKEATKTNSG